MSDGANSEEWALFEHDVVLFSLLEKMDGAPLLLVEAELKWVLRASLPEAKFTAIDLRTWAATISS